MPINISNKKCKNIYYSDSNKNVKEIAVVYDGSSVIYVKSFDAVTFTSSGTWTVPKGITKIKIDCVGAQGQNASNGVGGKGGRVQCTLKVNGGSVLNITVGKRPTSGSTASYNASDIRVGGTALSNRVVVAGGGGGASYASNGYSTVYANGGAGGGSTTGGSGTTSVQWGYGATAGTGGTQSAGGAGGTASTPYSREFRGGTGTSGLGGNGDTYTGLAGSGGAGYFGGGGGATSAFVDEKTSAAAAGGAGGGSSYANSSYCSSVTHTQGYRSGNGYVTISMAK